MYRQFLRAAAAACDTSGADMLTPGIIRFTLEYAAAPDLEAERHKLRELIGGDRFAFFPLPPGEDPLVHVLQFPGVLRQQSSGFLFDVAQRLVDDCGLRSCVPDVDPGWIADDELGRTAPDSAGGIVWTLCKSHAPAPADRRWAVAAVRADRAWSRFGTTGEGVVIGQPDTGVADHRETDGAIDIRRGTDVLRGGGLPIDPLSPSMASPGHGTATASAAVSRSSLAIVGPAPGATLVPIRCTNSVVTGGGAAVAAAIDHARLAQCDIVSLSLGGPIEGADVRRAIERAVDAGMVVLAAAGNCVSAVVYPAWDANVIAVAGVDADGRPWKGSSRGPKVDVSAPGENVHVARRHWPADPDKSATEAGQGTSFAVAITAGCAALWLARFTPAAVRAEAARRGVSVQELFRAAVRTTARRPAQWPGRSMGTGIVDAENLLALPLADIPACARPRNANPGAPLLAGVPDPARFLAEAGFLALDRQQRADPKRVAALESGVAARPSKALSATLATAKAEYGPLSCARAPAPATPLTPFVGPRALSGKLLRRRATTIAPPPAPAAVAQASKKELLDRVEAALHRAARPSATADRTREEIMTHAEAVIDAWARGAGIDTASASAARVAAEAIVRLTDRPAVKVVAGTVDADDPHLQYWADDLAASRRALKPVIDAVGRIDIDGPQGHVHIGTGTLVANGLVMTNRHVIEAFCEPIPSSDGRQKFLLNAPASICFDEAARDTTRRFAIKGVLTAGPWKIGEFADVGKLDVAVLEVETINAAGADLPAPAPSGPLLAGRDDRSKVVVVGYPVRPGLSAAVDPHTGEVATDLWERFWTLFGDEYGTKYVSPGHVVSRPGEIAGDERGWALSHDATVLAGNSGAPVISLRDPYRIGGLHFGGQTLRQNLAHDLAGIRSVVRDETQLLDLAAFGDFFGSA